MEIYFTVRAAGNFRSIKDYIELKFGETTSLAFEKKIEIFSGNFEKLSRNGKSGGS